MVFWLVFHDNLMPNEQIISLDDEINNEIPSFNVFLLLLMQYF